MADIRMSVVKFSTPTTTGNMDIVGDLGGATPKVAIFYTSRHTATNDPGVTAGNIVGAGATDGTRQFAGTLGQPDNEATVNADRWSRTTSCLIAISGTPAIVVAAAFVSFAADKVTLNFTVVEAAAAREMICVLLGGADLTAYVNTTTLNSGANSITAPGFEADALLAFSFNNNFSDAGAADAQLGFGCAINDGTLTQKSIVYFSNNATADQHSSMMSDSNAIMTVIAGDGTMSATHTLTAFTSNGFDVTASASTTGWGYIALALASEAFNLVEFSTPTVTGDATISIPGVTPTGAFLCVGTPDAWDTLENDTANACGFGMGAVTASGEAGSVALKVTEDADPTDTDMDVKATPLRCGISGGSAQSIAASFTSVGTEVLTLNYTAVNATARLGWLLAFGSAQDPDETGLETGETGETGDGVLGNIFRSPIFYSPIFHSPVIGRYGVTR